MISVDQNENMQARERPHGFAVRPLEEGDLGEMTHVWSQAGLPYRPKGRDSPESLRAQLNRDPDLFIGAFEGSRMIGVIVGSDDGRKGWLNRLAVLPDYRRRGVAKALIEACEDALRKRGRGVFSLHIEGRNEASESLFVGQGYEDASYIRYYVKRDSEET